MHEAEKLNLEQIEAFLNASEAIRFEGENRQQVYHWIEQVLRQQQYQKQGRKARGLLRRYLVVPRTRTRTVFSGMSTLSRQHSGLQASRT